MSSSFPLPSSSLNKSITSGWAVKPATKKRISLNATGSGGSSPRRGTSRAGSPAAERDAGLDQIVETDPTIPELVPSGSATPLDVDPLLPPSPPTKRPAPSLPPPPKRSRTRAPPTSSSSRLAPLPTRAALYEKYPPPDLSLSLLGGLKDQIEKLLEIVALPLLHPEIYAHTGVKPPRGVLLHGVPGGGKTRLVSCLAGELGLPFISVSAPSIIGSMSGDSEKTLRDIFADAKAAAPCLVFLDEVDAITPKRAEAVREMEKRVVGQLLTLMDDLAANPEPIIILGATNRPDSLDPALRRAGRFDHEIEMGVPSLEGREEILRVLCQSLRLAGDIDFHQLAVSTPGYVGADLTAVASAAGVVAVKRMFGEVGGGGIGGLIGAGSVVGLGGGIMETSGEEVEVGGVREGVEGMVVDEDETMGVELPAEREEITPTASKSVGPFTTLPPHLLRTPIASFLLTHPSPLTPLQLSPLLLIPSDFLTALTLVQPSSKREGFATIPDVTWADIGALSAVRDELHMAIVQPIRRPEIFKAVGIEAPSGVLLWGPPGCGKTLLAKAVANESRANFISVKGPELLNKYVGESEKAVRQVFARARASSPCVIFFDELDALVPRRDDSLSESSARVVNTLLTELDGLDARKAVYVIGATNRPDMIDPAMVRPGRLDKLLYVDLPSPQERVEILRTHMKKTPLEDGGWEEVVEIVKGDGCDGFSGADMAALVREAATLALRAALEQDGAFENDNEAVDASGAVVRAGQGDIPPPAPVIKVTVEHFRKASVKTMPSVSREQKRKYEALRNKFAGLPARGGRKWAEDKGLAGKGIEGVVVGTGEGEKVEGKESGMDLAT